jgi:hypothetical protein
MLGPVRGKDKSPLFYGRQRLYYYKVYPLQKKEIRFESCACLHYNAVLIPLPGTLR